VTDDEVIATAAEVEGKTVTEFMRDATLTHAYEVLADRRLFVLDDAAWVEFQARLRAPARSRPRLAELFSTPRSEVWDD
jgi:uncharacterized protein (DUF1778 family)